MENHHSRTTVTFLNVRTGQQQTSVVILPPPGGVPNPGPFPPPGSPYVLGVNAVPVVVHVGQAAAAPIAPGEPAPPPYPGSTRGLRIVSITPGSAAARAGLRVGDTLLTVGQSQASDIYALRRAVASSGGFLPMTVMDAYSNIRTVTAYLGGEPGVIVPLPGSAPPSP